MFRGKKLFWKYLATYLLVIALITISMFIMLRSMIRLQIDEAKDAQLEKLNIVAENVNNRFLQYNEIATLIYLDSAVSPSWIIQSDYNAYEAIQRLKERAVSSLKLRLARILLVCEYCGLISVSAMAGMQIPQMSMKQRTKLKRNLRFIKIPPIYFFLYRRFTNPKTDKLFY